MYGTRRQGFRHGIPVRHLSYEYVPSQSAVSEIYIVDEPMKVVTFG